jgi:Cellulose biosynthesis protein BcsS
MIPWRTFFPRTFTAALAVALSLATLCQSQAADPEPKRVLMLHSFGPRFKPWSDYEQSIRSEIRRLWQKPVDFLDQSLVNARLDDENSEALFAEYLRALYTGRPVDIIVAIGAPAAAFVQRYRQRLFPVTPMVLTAVEQRPHYNTGSEFFYLQGKTGVAIAQNLFVGPEAAFSGSWTYDQVRLGGHLTGFTFVGLSSGVSLGFVRDSNYGKGFYTGLNLQANF